MYCPQQISYTIRKNDTLYRIAQFFNTTVPAIVALNPGVNPYNLAIGSTVRICPGVSFFLKPGSGSNTAPSPSPDKQIGLINSMRLAWGQNAGWMRMLLLSAADRKDDQSAIMNRLLQNTGDITRILSGYYPQNSTAPIVQGLTRQVQMGAALMDALRDGRTDDADEISRQWYINADQLAQAFAGLSPYFSQQELRARLYQYQDWTKQQMLLRLAGNYTADIQAADAAEQEALKIADALAWGIIRQFPAAFA